MTRARTGPEKNSRDEAPAAVVRRLTTFPVKSLDGCDRESVRVVSNGGLDGDREFALFDSAGDFVNAKRERSIHRLRADFDPETRTLRVVVPASGRVQEKDETRPATKVTAGTNAAASAETFDVDDGADRARLTDLFSEYFGYEVSLRRNREGGFPDDAEASGPTVVSTATLREAASWFEGIDVDGMRRRLRANVELGASEGAEADDDRLPPFWEDRLFDRRGRVVDFSIGDVRFAGVNPCQRCVVPSRNPDTGAAYDGFRETFVRRRRETMPAWGESDWFDHDFRLMVNTRVDESSWGETLAVGDEVTVGDSRPAED